jgi:hypothetical protein
VIGVNKAGLEITWTTPAERPAKWGSNVGYYAIRYRPAYNSRKAAWTTARAGPEDVKKSLFAEKHSTECGTTYQIQIRTVGEKRNKGPWADALGSTQAC